MLKHVTALVCGMALCAGPTFAGWSQQGNQRIVQLAQILSSQAQGLAVQANAAANGWGATWADRKAARELAQFAGEAQRLAAAAQGCVGHNNGGHNNGGWNGGGHNGGWNGGRHNGGWNGNNGGNWGPNPGQNPPGWPDRARSAGRAGPVPPALPQVDSVSPAELRPGPAWPAPGHNNGGWNGGGHNGGWNGGGHNGGWNGGHNGGWNHDQVGQQLQGLFRDTWRQAADVQRVIWAAPRLQPLVPYWNQGVGNTLREMRQALQCGPGGRDSVRGVLFNALFGN